MIVDNAIEPGCGSKWNLVDLFTEPVDAVTARRLIGRLNGYSDFTVAIENERK